MPYGRRRGCACSTAIFPEGIHIPDYFFGKNIVAPADDEVPHLHDDDRRDEERVRRPAEHARGTTRIRWIHETLVDLLAIQKEIHTGLFAIMDGTTAGQRAWSAHDVSGREERDARFSGSSGDRRRSPRS